MLATGMCRKIFESIVGALYFGLPSMVLCRNLLELRCGLEEMISWCDARTVGEMSEVFLTSEQFFASPVFVPTIREIPPDY